MRFLALFITLPIWGLALFFGVLISIIAFPVSLLVSAIEYGFGNKWDNPFTDFIEDILEMVRK